MEHTRQLSITESSHTFASAQPDGNSPNSTTETSTFGSALSITTPSAIDPMVIDPQTQPDPSSKHPSSQSRDYDSASFPSSPLDIPTILTHLGLSRTATHTFGVWRSSNTHVKALAKVVADIADSIRLERVQQPRLLRPNIDTLLSEFGTRVWGRYQDRVWLDIP
jgi:hypothetical protein